MIDILFLHIFKGRIPKEIGELANLTHLRLSYNAFMSTPPTELGKLQNLRLLHLHGNRLEGIIPDIDTQFMNGQYSFITGEERRTALICITSSFISFTNFCVHMQIDCGVPTAFEDPLECEKCSVCCTYLGPSC